MIYKIFRAKRPSKEMLTTPSICSQVQAYDLDTGAGLHLSLKYDMTPHLPNSF